MVPRAAAVLVAVAGLQTVAAASQPWLAGGAEPSAAAQEAPKLTRPAPAAE
jgi:hypothetical protein